MNVVLWHFLPLPHQKKSDWLQLFLLTEGGEVYHAGTVNFYFQFPEGKSVLSYVPQQISDNLVGLE